jgi:undecaprenyl-diphosphatase
VAWFTYKKRFWPDGASLIFAGAGGLMLIVGLKYLFHRPRPYAIFSHLSYSFPSGHSFFALVLYGMTAYWLTRDLHEPHQKAIWAATGLMVLLVGFSRVALGEHFPSDVVAGYAVALPWLWASLAIPQTFHRSGRDLTTAEASRSLLSIL